MTNNTFRNEIIKKKREAVAERILNKSSNITSRKINRISPLDLRILFEHYDEIFFDSWFRKNFRGQMLFELSRRMTRSAGITKCPKNVSKLNPEQVKIIICIGADFFFQYDHIQGSKLVCGIETHNGLEALQIVFEHELIHAYEFINFNSSSCSEHRFKDLAGNLFGHTQSHHQIPTNRMIASEKLGISIGDEVHFLFENKRLKGIITNINKRATVMVKNQNGSYADKSGNRYMKYYVPLNELIK